MGRVRIGGVVRAALACAACLLTLALGPAAAKAALTIESFSTGFHNASGESETQAGAGIWSLRSSFALGQSGGVGTVEDAVLRLPPGLFVNPTAAPRCGSADFEAFECSSATQVGLIVIHAKPAGEPATLLGTAPVYTLQPEPGEIARLGAIAPVLEIPIEVPVTLAADAGYAPELTFEDLPEATPLTAVDLEIWGVPADPGHDSARFPAGSPTNPAGCPGIEGTGCLGGLSPSAAPAIPLLKSPTSCSGPLQSRLDVISHQGAIAVAMASAPGLTGCSKLGFSPQFEAATTSAATNTPTGLDLGFQVVDEGLTNPKGLSQSAVKNLSVELPPELEIDPEAIEALDTCSAAEFDARPPACPASSAVGTSSLEIVGFEAPLTGNVYLGAPDPTATPRLLVAVSSPRASIRLTGQIQPGPEFDQATVVLPSLPQLPVEALALVLAPSAGLFLTPVKCGAYAGLGTFTPWSAPSESLFIPQEFVFDSAGVAGGPCPGPASRMEVTMSPPAIVADGSSASLATATVTDAGGIAVPGDEVVFSSSDPGQRIGRVSDNLDGTYTARITSSTAPGPVAITAADTSVDPKILGSATLIQLAPPVPATPPISARPRVTLTKKPKHRTHDRTPTFRFISSVPSSTFACKVDTRPFRRCTSPKTLGPLPYGRHTFSVRATDATGTVSKPASWKFGLNSYP